MNSKPQFKVLAVLSIVCGILLLFEGYGYIRGINHLWPVLPLVLGIGLILLFFQRARADLAILGIGTYLILASGLFFYLNFTSWGMLASLWPLFLAFLGFAFLVPSAFGGPKKIFVPLGFFLIFLCVVFILVFTVNPRLWPISLVLFGICLLLIGRYS